MFLMYAGYMLVIFLSCAVSAAFVLPTHSNPAKGALALLVLLPLMAFGFSGELLTTVGQDQQRIRDAIKAGKISRRRALLSGVASGIVAVLLILATWHIGFAISNSSTAAVTVIVLIILEVMMAPIVGAACLVELAKKSV